MAIATLGTQAAIYKGGFLLKTIDFIPQNSLLRLPGGLFGIGMIFTRGCISRMTVLAGTGNIRALFVI